MVRETFQVLYGVIGRVISILLDNVLDVWWFADVLHYPAYYIYL